MEQPIIQIKNLKKSFGEREVLKDINFDVHKGEVVTIIGSSGSGKSTLLRCINLLERPTGGEIMYNGKNILDGGKVHQYCAKVGMVFQQFNLFNNMNVLENCVVGQMKVLKCSREEAEERAKKYLSHVGMLQYINARPRQLSGGQKQRVAIARALATNPKIILCDEATSALDPATTQSILSLLKEINRKFGITIVIITHEMSVVESICSHVAIIDGG
jgi:putative lysine transport system ATP-binding protein